jgi:hypothetical protein
MTEQLPRGSCLLAGVIVLGVLCGPPHFLSSLRGKSGGWGRHRTSNAPRQASPGPDLSHPKNPITQLRACSPILPVPATGLGPVNDDHAQPYVNNEEAREMRIPPTYRVANLNNAAGRNLMPWVREVLSKQN